MQLPTDHSSFVNPVEAQQILKISRKQLNDLLKSGTLPAKKVGKKWQILGKDLMQCAQMYQNNLQSQLLNFDWT